MKISKMAHSVGTLIASSLTIPGTLKVYANSVNAIGAQAAAIQHTTVSVGAAGATGATGATINSSSNMTLLHAEGIVARRFVHNGTDYVLASDTPINPLIVGLSFSDAQWRGRCNIMWGEDANPSGKLYVSNTRFTEYVDMFHFNTWQKITNNAHQDYMSFTLNNINGIEVRRLCFNSQETLDAYAAWLSEHEARYAPGEMALSPLPGLPSGVIASHVYALDKPEIGWDQMVAYWAWIIQHVSGRVYFCPGRIAFETAGDAIAFALNFKNQ